MRPRDDRDETIGRLRAKVGELTMEGELLCTKVERLEGGAPLAGRRYGVARVCRVWGVARFGVHRLRCAAVAPPGPGRRPGPQGPMDDTGLVTAIRQVLTDSPFHGEG